MTYRGDVAQLVFLASEDLPQDAAHNLARSGLGKVGNNVHRLGSRKRTNAPSHLHDKLLAEGVRNVGYLLDGDKGVDGLSSQFILDTDDGGLGDVVMLNESSLDFGSR